ncbi:hypothetical protein [Sodalis sp. dw_96]|uniref:hypothetical protein n=1 Tax=Sodalis sp. dw_96 TaxID=2719794 RepID=UPI001BD5DDE0|nr:hypothetical protein [Sodalis sp. dw_96]
MANFAIIEDNVVINIIVWDGVSKWEIPTSESPVGINDNVVVGIGYSYNPKNGIFTAPDGSPKCPL